MTSCIKVLSPCLVFPLASSLLEQYHYWLPYAVAVALFPLPTPVESFGQVLPVRTSILSVHLLSSIACLLSLEGVECPWQEQRSSLYTARWSGGCAPVSSSKRQSRADEGSGSGYRIRRCNEAVVTAILWFK